MKFKYGDVLKDLTSKTEYIVMVVSKGSEPGWIKTLSLTDEDEPQGVADIDEHDDESWEVLEA